MMATTYYDVPLLKPPVWSWEVPAYLFVGGVAGGAAVIGAVAQWTGANGTLTRDARWVAAAGAPICAALLTADLGRPERFINMLRVFKPQSAMSVGSWTLAAFSASSAAGIVPISAISTTAAPATALLGCGMLTYTGVLIGATAIPVWHEHVRTLPVHFAASGMGAAAALLTLLGHDDPALNRVAIGAAAVETLVGASIESRGGRESTPLREGVSGWVVRAGGVLSGPVPLILRSMSRSRGARQAASVAALAGSLLTRVGWILAGRASAASDSQPTRSERQQHESRRPGD
ncbi:MAG TPA: NrfD/PsrC family molybdoenzyme membrane anchor subunit [Vicinamibacterales bacterium]|nr:NrfD/PsrC family molybdoenzyme membrane anchor subunit [Vicinamibacterales bacterium]